ncbi:MAG: hypothetical protein NC395_03220 [Prevotella sp.]|nr:hypothetical protein [Prevotella sp.]
MASIKVILAGIVLILSSLFCMNIVIVPDGFVLGLFIFGIIVSVIGLFFVKDYEDNDESGDEEDYGEEEDI